MFLNEFFCILGIPSAHFHRTVFIVFGRILTKLLLISYIHKSSVYIFGHGEILTKYFVATTLSKSKSWLTYGQLFLIVWHFSFEKSVFDGSLLREYFKTFYNEPHHDSVLKFYINFSNLLFDINVLNDIRGRTFIFLLSYFWKLLINVF